MLKKATENAREKEIRNISFTRSTAERLPFPDARLTGLPVAELSTCFKIPQRR